MPLFTHRPRSAFLENSRVVSTKTMEVRRLPTPTSVSVGASYILTRSYCVPVSLWSDPKSFVQTHPTFTNLSVKTFRLWSAVRDSLS